AMTVGSGPVARSLPVVTLAHVPPLPADPARSRLLAGAYAQPWPGSVQLVDDATGATLAELGRRAVLGEIVSAVEPGPVAVWDEGRGFEVSLLAGHLAAAERWSVLAGSN